ncbi:tripeptidyl peptidase A [Talaromyces proteolyticus]|uniref:tripeptidyl-peptidase II n=1 Tax=Talaromyces proteolyticus TaxID=1131652 RepID=A0AAD4PYG1_9EURO|nr:tripeptidyl peptidase A [Talaromyces proteolyticus]KAH8694224.1 tripeptidyl peptidase A [Talaromyces proteolyticus]
MVRNFLLAVCLLSSLSVRVAGNPDSHEYLSGIPSGWSHASKPGDNTSIHLSISLALQNIDQLETELRRVSTPDSSEYGQYQDSDEVLSKFGPSQASVAAVTSWLMESDIEHIYNNNQSISFFTTVSQANSLLNAKFDYYTDGSISKLRTLSYSIPRHLKQDIDLISPTTYFGKSTAARNIHFHKSKREMPGAATSNPPSSISVAPSCQSAITPDCVKQLYSIGNYTPTAKSGSRIGFGSFLNNSAIYADLARYEKYYGLPSQNFTKVLINNPINDQNPTTPIDAESNLDVQTILGVAHPLPITEYLTGGSPPFIPSLESPTNNNEPYLPYYEYLLSQQNEDLPQVISNSYGDEEQTVPLKYAIRTCNLIGLMGLRGITVVESSADEGLGRGCLSNDGNNKTQFEVFFPSTCPYLLSVGGTQETDPEIAWTAGSGGFSNYFPRPWYQEDVITTYLGYVDPDTKSYYTNFTNFEGRGFPDVAAHSLGPGYGVFYKGNLVNAGGNSAAAPVWAAIIALLNDARLSAGKPALGFLNPLLYHLGSTNLNDITAGGSVGCSGIHSKNSTDPSKRGFIPWASWNATVGWDPVTGLGTPNFSKLKETVLYF